MSFSVPHDLSFGGNNETWAVNFLASMQSRWEKCKTNLEVLEGGGCGMLSAGQWLIAAVNTNTPSTSKIRIWSANNK
ncbi:hypothetical protein SLEP1_g47053 [Rubroshorea leprosula]|uniref:Uncharacterized protein n=1 Tax=Rubroshorea leprosula TaxID=152421 RepID=A0AAV5LP69_9ROSI|nr:hypothetical protein SLEP1_g47053 [Rubroshorea leprosula]